MSIQQREKKGERQRRAEAEAEVETEAETRGRERQRQRQRGERKSERQRARERASEREETHSGSEIRVPERVHKLTVFRTTTTLVLRARNARLQMFLHEYGQRLLLTIDGIEGGDAMRQVKRRRRRRRRW